MMILEFHPQAHLMETIWNNNGIVININVHINSG